MLRTPRAVLLLYAIGALAVFVGLVPWSLGLTQSEVTPVVLSESVIRGFLQEPNGEKLANCARATLSSSQACSNLSSRLVGVIAWLSVLSVVFGLAVIAGALTVHRQLSSQVAR